MKFCTALIVMMLNLKIVAVCDTCPVQPDHSTYLSINTPFKLFINPATDFITGGLALEYQTNSSIRYGVDLITSSSLSNVSETRPLQFAISPSIGIVYKEWNTLKLYQKTAVGISTNNERLYTSRDQSFDTKRVSRGIVSTEMILCYKLGKRKGVKQSVVSYNIGFASDLGAIPILSDVCQWGYSNSGGRPYSGFFTGLSIGLNLYKNKEVEYDF
tara:strand:+ start:149 stop:793 length:645 start_codon:yes stop_codon:yes gene_type:complete